MNRTTSRWRGRGWPAVIRTYRFARGPSQRHGFPKARLARETISSTVGGPARKDLARILTSNGAGMIDKRQSAPTGLTWREHVWLKPGPLTRRNLRYSRFPGVTPERPTRNPKIQCKPNLEHSAAGEDDSSFFRALRCAARRPTACESFFVDFYGTTSQSAVASLPPD
jgi:hypothetical protein